MLTTRTPTRQPVLETPVRNHYFYGKLLDVYQFEMETQYQNAKRWLLNRLVTGYGVVCGLDVVPGAETNEIWIEPGVAIDQWGREILVDRRTGPIVLPAHLLEPYTDGDDGYDDDEDEGGAEHDEEDAEGYAEADPEPTRDRRGYRTEATSESNYAERPTQVYQGDRKHRREDDRRYGRDDERQRGYDSRRQQYGDDDDDHGHHDRGDWVQVRICYLECKTDPTPVFAGDCDTAQLCAPGTIRERFSVDFVRGRHPRPDPECLASAMFPSDRLDYASLARFVTEPCPDPPDDPCIVLANIRLLGGKRGHDCHPDNIDITVRPIVYGNDLLFKLLLSDDDEEREARDYRNKG